MKPEVKKLLILNLPYLLFVYLFDKVGAAVRLSPGADMSAKLLHLGNGFTAAFSGTFLFNAATVALGELAVCYILGLPLLALLTKLKVFGPSAPEMC